jgi:predicted AlkP superfamily pyrophosphatase or phosphodiesterase
VLLRAAHERSLDDLIHQALERPMSRRAFLQRGRDLGLTLAASSLLTACASTALGGVSAARYLVMLIIDAARSDYLGYGDLPNIRSLMQRGTFYDSAWVGQLESITPASHATIATGCFPASDGGILGFWWEDPETHTNFTCAPLNASDPDSLARLLANSGTPTIAEYLKRHDPHARVYTASGSKFYAADGAGGPHADYINYFWTTQSGGWAPLSIPGHDLPADLINDRRFILPNYKTMPLGQQDALVGQLAVELFQREKPRIMILNLPEMDWPVAHLNGGPLDPAAVRTLMENADRLLGQIIEAYRQAGVLDQTVFMLLGDHGVIPLEKLADPSLIHDAIKQAGTDTVTFDYHTGCFVWLEDPSRSAAVAAAIENAKIPNVSAVYYLTQQRGQLTYVPGPTTSGNVRGTLDGAYRYLLQTMAGNTAAHIVVFYPERTGSVGAGGNYKWLGDHGGASWGSQAIPLILAGPGIKSGYISHFPARLVDLAPTAMRLMGVPYPRCDGVVLADALTNPSQADRNRQAQVARYLIPYAAALRQRSHLDTQGQPTIAPKSSSSSSGSQPIAVNPSY